MSVNMMPSQEKLYNILLKGKGYFRRSNVIIFGSTQIGKTYLMKHIAEQRKNYRYINFVREYLEEFISVNDLSSIIFNDFQEFLRKKFENAENKQTEIIIDEIDAIVSLIVGSNDDNLGVFYKQLLSMDLSLKYIFVCSIFDDKIIQNLTRLYKDRIYTLDFNSFDKRYIIKRFFTNVDLFDLEQINNIRQFNITKY